MVMMVDDHNYSYSKCLSLISLSTEKALHKDKHSIEGMEGGVVREGDDAGGASRGRREGR